MAWGDGSEKRVPVTFETRDRLEDIKREDERYDDVLRRVARGFDPDRAPDLGDDKAKPATKMTRVYCSEKTKDKLADSKRGERFDDVIRKMLNTYTADGSGETRTDGSGTTRKRREARHATKQQRLFERFSE